MMIGTALRPLIQSVLLLPALPAFPILPVLLVSAPENLRDGNFTGAIFGIIAPPAALVLVASIFVPAAWRQGRFVRAGLVVGLLAAVIACLWIAGIMFTGPDGTLRPPQSARQFLMIAGPLVVAVWNLVRFTFAARNGRSVALR